MNKKKFLGSLLLFLALVLFPAVSNATWWTYEFSGELIYLEDDAVGSVSSLTYSGQTFNLGDTFTGMFSFDSTNPVASANLEVYMNGVTFGDYDALDYVDYSLPGDWFETSMTSTYTQDAYVLFSELIPYWGFMDFQYDSLYGDTVKKIFEGEIGDMHLVPIPAAIWLLGSGLLGLVGLRRKFSN